MPRVNLSLTQDMYDRIEKEAKKQNITVNYYICEMLKELPTTIQWPLAR